ncbi:hypothetical protein J2744_001316 [Halorubrum trapanicum]|uniref:Uncharacterized protein n=1 Tax=Halorubrum trapanicum TaxID=29284 RepID=A0A8J7UKW7_9EURY|nr:hypothetical protein [Halorubrum trapanicum]MBP1901640.1 hypothetical protein [Halorubrum trapanicum]
MPSPFRVFETWFALLLTVGTLARITAGAASSLSRSAEILVGPLLALCVAVGLLWRDPDLNVGRLWRVGFTAYAVGIAIAVVGIFGGWLAAYDRYVFPVAVGIALLMEPVYESGVLPTDAIPDFISEYQGR